MVHTKYEIKVEKAKIFEKDLPLFSYKMERKKKQIRKGNVYVFTLHVI